MIGLERMSGIWTFLLAVPSGIVGGAVSFCLFSSMIISLIVAAALIVTVVALCQWA